jgi:asparagine synthase (glutamine-hydrolysing)
MSFLNTAEAFAMINNSYFYKSFSDQCAKQNGMDIISALAGQTSKLSSTDAMTYTDIQYYLINKYLPKIDYATMAHSIEARSPFLDYRLFELGFSLPDNVKFRNLTRKAVLKKLASKYFDRSFVYRKKGGFSPPINSWLRQGKYEQIVRKIILRESCIYELFQKQEVVDIIDGFYKGNNSHFRKIWLFLWFQIWECIFISKCFSKDNMLSELGK